MLDKDESIALLCRQRDRYEGWMMDKTAGREFLESEAYLAGRLAGKHGLSSSLNPHSVGSFEYIQWNQGRSIAVLENITSAAPVRARPCIYFPNTTCDCGGRGYCLAVV